MFVLLAYVGLVWGIWFLTSRSCDRSDSTLGIGIIFLSCIMIVCSSPRFVDLVDTEKRYNLIEDITFIDKNYTDDFKEDAMVEKITKYNNHMEGFVHAIPAILWYPFPVFKNYDKYTIDIDTINFDNYVDIITNIK